MEPTPVVYLLVPLSLSYGREVIRGVREYTRANRLWQLAVAEPTARNVRTAKRESPSGVIGMFGTETLERAARGLKIPTVNTSSCCKVTRLHRVIPDNQAIGELAAEHFLQRGFRHFAIAGFRDQYFSHVRCQGFVDAVAKSGYECISMAEGHDARAIRGLPKPVGIFACNDVRGRQIIAGCIRARARVPEDVAVVGVDNDETLCELAEVPLSSVDPAARRVGYEAAAVLDRLMGGRGAAAAAEPKLLTVPPAELVVRSSSDVLAVPDDQVATAMRYMQAHACDPMRVEDMMDVLKVSRRTLEKRFRTIFGRTLHDEIRRLQFERARQLLYDTDLKIPQVATKCGFRDAKRFTTLFREEFGSPPIMYRRDARETAQ